MHLKTKGCKTGNGPKLTHLFYATIPKENMKPRHARRNNDARMLETVEISKEKNYVQLKRTLPVLWSAEAMEMKMSLNSPDEDWHHPYSSLGLQVRFVNLVKGHFV